MNFKVTIEQPREIKTKQTIDLSIDVISTFVYGVKVKNERDAMPAIRTTLVGRLKALRKQGLRMTTPELLKADLLIERI
jgi:hypothetical protein